jgi:hypothetical protein
MVLVSLETPENREEGTKRVPGEFDGSSEWFSKGVSDH